MLERMFRLSARGTDARTETLAGLTTFLTMAYIIFVQPAVLSVDLVGKPTGMDFGGVLLATCLGSAFASILMGLLADYPIALAPGMGENFFFVTVVMGLGALGIPDAWQTALGMVLLSGLVFILLTLRIAQSILSPIKGLALGAQPAGCDVWQGCGHAAEVRRSENTAIRTDRPLRSSSMPIDALVSPLPSELTTPPVTKMCLVMRTPP